jgi:hypothetical protein
MTDLQAIIGTLSKVPPDATIYAVKPWRCDSPAVVVQASDEPPETLDYFLEVDLATEVFRVWSGWRGGRQPTLKEACAAVLHYAVNDAYEPVDGGE